jgi:hypothetical protein
VNAPSVNTTIDLSANGTSNSYIVNSTDANYQFDATVMGNGVIPESQKAVLASATIAKNAAYKAVVLWSTGTSISSIVQNVKYDSTNGIITFNTPAKSSMLGNAVIALEDGTGKILWSWHIWRTSYNPSAANGLDTYTYNVGDSIKGSLKMMKYNLGATQMANILGPNAYENGLLYQWGRKDPFLSGKGISNTEPVKGTDYFIDVTASTIDFIVGNKSKLITDDGSATVNTAIANPMTFYREQASGYDWLSNGTEAIIKNNDLWGNPPTKSSSINRNKGTKSMFDPCPPGYMIAPQYTGYKSSTYATDGTYTRTNDGIIYHNGSVSTLLPAVGIRQHTSGILSDVAMNGTIWFSTTPNVNPFLASMLGYNNRTLASPLGTTYRAFGLATRCCVQ